MGEKGEGSGGEGGGNWGERGRELGMGYPPVHPLKLNGIPTLINWTNSFRISESLGSEFQ